MTVKGQRKPLSFYEGKAQKLCADKKLQFVKFEPRIMKSGPGAGKTVDYTHSTVHASPCHRCNGVGQCYVNTLEKYPAGLIYCEGCKTFTGKPVTNQQRKAKALGMVAHLGLKDVQKVNEEKTENRGAGNELLSYACPREPCPRRPVHAVNTIISHGGPRPCRECAFEEEVPGRLASWGYKDGKVEDIKYLERNGTGNIEIDQNATDCSVCCEGCSLDGTPCPHRTTRQMNTLRAAARDGLQSIRCDTCRYVVYEGKVVMNGYEGRTASILIKDRGYSFDDVHTTHRVWVEVAPVGGIALPDGGIACPSGKRSCSDLLVATQLPKSLQANGSETLLITSDNYEAIIEKLGIGKAASTGDDSVDIIETKHAFIANITPYFIQMMKAYQAKKLVYEVAMYWEDNPEPQFIRTVEELEAALDKCKALYPTIVPAPRRFTDVEMAKAFFAAKAKGVLTKKRAADGTSAGLTEEQQHQLADALAEDSLADL